MDRIAQVGILEQALPRNGKKPGDASGGPSYGATLLLEVDGGNALLSWGCWNWEEVICSTATHSRGPIIWGIASKRRVQVA